MPGGQSIILLATGWVYRELAAAGGLAEDTLIDAGNTRDPYPAQEHHGRVLRYPSERFIPATTVSSSSDTPEGQYLDELYAGLLGRTVVHLAVLGRPDPPAPGAQPEDASPAAVKDLTGLVRWYKSFQSEAQRRLGKRADELDHILVIVCRDDLTREDLAPLQALAGPRADGSAGPKIGKVYVLFSRLELGRNRAVHARHVWPQLAGALLMHLLWAETRTEHPASTAARAFVWRCLKIVPEVDSDQFREQLQHGFREAYREVLPGLSDDTGPPPQFRLDLDLSPWIAAEKGAAELGTPAGGLGAVATDKRPTEWYAFPAREEAERLGAESRWRDALHRAAEGLLRELSAHAMGLDPETINTRAGTGDEPAPGPPGAESEGSRALARSAEAPAATARDRGRGVSLVWARVHERPAAVFAGVHTSLSPGDGRPRQEGDGVSAHCRDLEKELRDALAEIARLDVERARGLAVARECAEEYVRAAQNYVPRRVRVWLALTAMALVAYLGMFAARALMNLLAAARGAAVFVPSWWVSGSIVGLCAGLGALTAALYSAWREWRQGEAARKDLTGFFEEVDGLVRNRHGACLRLCRSSIARWYVLRAESIANTARSLLRRLSCVVAREVRPEPASARLVPRDLEGQPHAGSPGTDAESMRARQRDTMRDFTTHRISCTDMKGWHDQVRRAVRETVGEFGQAWKRLTERWDPRYCGNIPVSQVVPFLREHRRRLEASVLQQLRGWLIKSLSDTALEDHLKTLLNSSELASFEHFATAILPEGMKLRTTLFVCPDRFEAVRKAIALPGDTGLARLGEGCPPYVLAYLFSEAPVEFELGPDERVRVAGKR